MGLSPGSLCRSNEAGSAVGQLALRRPASAAVHASDCPERWPASVNQPAGAALAGHTAPGFPPKVLYTTGPVRAAAPVFRPAQTEKELEARRTSHAYLMQQLEQEPWISATLHPPQSDESGLVRERLFGE